MPNNKTIREEFEEKIEKEFIYLKKGDNAYGLAAKTVAKEEGKKAILTQLQEIEDMVEGRKVPPPTKNDDSIYPIVVDVQNKLINDLLSALKEKKDKLNK